VTSDRPFTAPFWLGSAHLQTLGAALPLWAPPATFRPSATETVRVAIPGGGALHAHAFWHEGGAPRPLAILVHGVGGSSASRYVVRAAVSLYRAGRHVVRLDLRGAGASIPDAPRLYHAGLTEDPRLALAHFGKDPRVAGVALVGFSLGGHVLLRLAGELGADVDPVLRAVVAISAPVDLTRVTMHMERARSLPYHAYVLRNLVRQGRDFARAHPERARYDAGALWRTRSVRAYDTRVIAPMHGFASAEDYYERASAGPMLARIVVPTLLVHAEDDPMVPPESVRPWLAVTPRAPRAPRAIEEAWSARGGHVGWFAGVDEASWVDTWAMRHTRAFLERHARA
jgi:predicted alpha/beta-fold hydrolase